VRLSHRNLVSNVRAITKIDLNAGVGDRFLSLLPLSHTFELTAGFLLPLHGGAAIALPRAIAASEILAALSEERITILIAVPRLFRNLMQGLEKRFAAGGAPLRAYLALLRRLPIRLRRLANAPIRRRLGGRPRAWVSGGARLDPEITRFFRDLGLPLRQGYGLTETSPVVSVQRDGDPLLDSIGLPIEGVEVRIHEPDANGVGELLVRGPNVMLGYVDEAQTREVMLGEWFRTGDLGRFVPGGLVLTGRRKRLIVTEAGKNVYPDELEFLLERYPQVREAGVVEVNMEPAAVLAMDGANAADEARSLLKEFNARISSHNRITRFALVEQLPRTPLGKVAIKELPELFARHEVRS
jgi:long-chain acyl-CoA synthetase